MVDHYENERSGLGSPASGNIVITPNDSTDLATIPRGIEANVAGLMRYVALNGVEAITYMPRGVIKPIRPSRIYSTGTDASSFIGYF